MPTITSISRSSGTAGTNMTLTGSDFTGATAVKFGATLASFTVNSDTSISVTVPGGLTIGSLYISNADVVGTVDITGTTPNGTSLTSSADQFTFSS